MIGRMRRITGSSRAPALAPGRSVGAGLEGGALPTDALARFDREV